MLWDLASGTLLHVFAGHQDTVVAIDVIQDGSQVISSSYDGTVKLWDLQTGELLATYDHGPARPWDVAFHPDGQHAITSHSEGNVAYWNLAEGSYQLFEGHAGNVFGATIHPDGQRAFGVHGGTIIVWSLPDGEILQELVFAGAAGVVEVTPDGKYLYVGSGNETPTVWDLETYELFNILEGQQGNMGNNSVDIAADSRTAVVVSWNGTVFVWDLIAGEILRRFPGHDSIVTGAAISPNGQTGYSGRGDLTVVEWAITPPDLDFILGWIADNRIIRQFTCEERVLYQLEPCGAAGE